MTEKIITNGRFYFLRHGETTWNAARKTQGQSDSPLSDLGREQARCAGEAMASLPIARIVASPLQRARHTAEAVARNHDVPMTFDDELMECHLGEMQEEPHGDWLIDYWNGDFDPPGGEHFTVFASRVWHAMHRAIALGPNTLIVAHGGLWKAAHAYTTVTPANLPMPNALPLEVEIREGIWHNRVIGVSQ